MARRISSDAIPVGGFTPGAILDGRYRIIGLLGRGGMGEVYRADDLKLGQPVALKFLPRELASDPVRRERFFSEVRITRQLAHPNICRVYDIAEFEGQHFLSMEYIDGEDLASLIRRIGYLTNEKALDIARQLTAGIAAAHDRGVLHRDLKPANIMINGHGRVRITDFGLAIAAGDDTQTAEMFGTPAYMAPEQFAGKGSSVRSDIYALGLILYEIYSGRKAFTATTIAELREQKEGRTPTAPSEIRQGVDPIVDRVIMRCLERDPRARPAAAAQVAAALPGGDPLAAALAAGETPSPEMVAAAGLKEGLRPAVAWALLASLILLTIACVWMMDRTYLFQRLKSSKSPDALAEQARTFIRQAGYSDAPADSDVILQADPDFLTFQNGPDTKTFPIPWDNLSSLSPFLFSYRQSPRPLERFNILFWNSPAAIPMDPPVFFPGEVAVRLDTEGRLRSLRAIPPATDTAAPQTKAPDWAWLLSAAGLDIGTWLPTEPHWNPESYADSRAAWEGSFPDAPGIPIRIEAAAHRGKPVSFTVIYPWTRSERMPEATSNPYVKILSVFGTVIFVMLVAGPVFFARQNLRLGRGDRRGANRMVIALVLAPHTVGWILAEHHVSTFWELALFLGILARLMLFGGLIWTLYIAIEPFVRRRWPQILISWTRLLSGEWNDPVVGRDVLIGCVAAAAQWSLAPLSVLLSVWFGRPQTALMTAAATPWIGTSSFIAGQAFMGSVAVTAALAMTFIFLLLRSLLRKDWLAASVVVLILTTPDPGQFAAAGPWLAIGLNLISAIIIFFVGMRFGLVAFAAMGVVTNIFATDIITLQASWYAGYGYAALFLIAALAFYGFRTSLGGQPALKFSPIDAEPESRS
jgi:serine/threonine-protein kinase